MQSLRDGCYSIRAYSDWEKCEVETARIASLDVAKVTFDAFVTTHPKCAVWLRQGARVMKSANTNER